MNNRKNKKPTVNGLAFGNLRYRKKQYLTMVIGIILSMVLCSVAIFFLTSIPASSEEMHKQTYGTNDSIYIADNKEIFEEMKKAGVIKSSYYAYTIGFVNTDETNPDIGFAVGYFDDNAKDIAYITFEEGGYPQNDFEIALEKATLNKINPDLKIGDKVTLDVQIKNGPENLNKSVKKEYTLVGIAKNKASNLYEYDRDLVTKNIPGAYVYNGAQVEPGGKAAIVGYMFFIDGERSGHFTRMSDFFETHNENRLNYIHMFNNHSLDFKSTETFETIIFSVAIIAILVIAALLGIINAFSGNLKGRHKQIGMLRTVGATKRQIINIFGREAFFISLICTPVSVVSAYFITLFAARYLGEDFIFIPNIPMLILSGIVSVIFVLTAAFIPLISATRVSPLQAIRNIEYTRKVKTKKIKTQQEFEPSRLLGKRSSIFSGKKQAAAAMLLGLSVIISSFAFSFLEGPYKQEFLGEDYYEFDYNITSHAGVNSVNNIANQELTETMRSELLSLPYIESVNGNKHIVALLQIPEYTNYTLMYSGFNSSMGIFYYEPFEGMNEENFKNAFTPDGNHLKLKQELGIKANVYDIDVESVEDEVIKKFAPYVADGEIDIDKLNSGEQIIMIGDKKHFVGSTYEDAESHYEGGWRVTSGSVDGDENIEKYDIYYIEAENPYKVGDKLDFTVLRGVREEGDGFDPLRDFTDIKKNETKTEIGAIIHELPSELYLEIPNAYGFCFLTTHQGLSHFIEKNSFNNFNVTLNTECNDEIDGEVQKILKRYEENSREGCFIHSKYEIIKNDSRTYQRLYVCFIAFIVLILAIFTTIITNTIATRIRESTKEIGTLRAVGATTGDIWKSFVYQFISLFLKGLIGGFTVFGAGYFICWLTYIFYYKELLSEPFVFKLTLWQTILSCIVIFIICSLNLYLKVKKEMKKSVVENIREL